MIVAESKTDAKDGSPIVCHVASMAVFRHIYNMPYREVLSVCFSLVKSGVSPSRYKTRGLKLLEEMDDGYYRVLDPMHRHLVIEGGLGSLEYPSFSRVGQEVFAPGIRSAFFPELELKSLTDKNAPQPMVYILANNFYLKGKTVCVSPMVYEMDVPDFHVFYERDYGRGSRRKPRKKESKSVRRNLWGWLVPDPA